MELTRAARRGALLLALSAAACGSGRMTAVDGGADATDPPADASGQEEALVPDTAWPELPDGGGDEPDAADRPDAPAETRDAGDTAGTAEDEGTPPAPLFALLSILEDGSAAVAALTANAGYATVYSLAVPVRAGDLLHIRGQVEITCEYERPTRGTIRLLMDGSVAGSESSQNCITHGAHHMPLWSDALWEAAADGSATVAVQYAATRSGASPTVKVEDGYGHLVVEQYRRFDTPAAAAAAGARLLADVTADTRANAASFGTEGRFVKTQAYDVDVAAGAGDLVRLLGQTTARWTRPDDGRLELHAAAIFLGETKLSPWSTENVYWNIQTVPLWEDAFAEIGAAGTRTYQSTMHGVFVVGAAIVADAGQLVAMRFRPAPAASCGGLLHLAAARSAAGPTGASSYVANSGWSYPVDAALALRAGDVVRVTGYLQLAHPGDVDYGIACTAQSTLLDGGGTLTGASPLTPKYVTGQLEVLPLRTEQVTRVAADGAYTARLGFTCGRSGFSPTLSLAGGRTILLIERYSACSP